MLPTPKTILITRYFSTYQRHRIYFLNSLPTTPPSFVLHYLVKKTITPSRQILWLHSILIPGRFYLPLIFFTHTLFFNSLNRSMLFSLVLTLILSLYSNSLFLMTVGKISTSIIYASRMSNNFSTTSWTPSIDGVSSRKVSSFFVDLSSTKSSLIADKVLKPSPLYSQFPSFYHTTLILSSLLT